MTHWDKLSTSRRRQNQQVCADADGPMEGWKSAGLRGKTDARGEGQGPTTGPVFSAARLAPIAHRVDFRYNPNRSDKT